MRTLTFKGGPCDGLTAELDHRDTLPVIRVAVIADRAVVLTASIGMGDLDAAHGRWVDYFRWPSMDPDGPAEYRSEKPPTFAAGFSASG